MATGSLVTILFVSYGRHEFKGDAPISVGWFGSGTPERKLTKFTFGWMVRSRADHATPARFMRDDKRAKAHGSKGMLPNPPLFKASLLVGPHILLSEACLRR